MSDLSDLRSVVGVVVVVVVDMRRHLSLENQIVMSEKSHDVVGFLNVANCKLLE